jgi:hypothetical protein
MDKRDWSIIEYRSDEGRPEFRSGTQQWREISFDPQCIQDQESKHEAGDDEKGGPARGRPFPHRFGRPQPKAVRKMKKRGGNMLL